MRNASPPVPRRRRPHPAQRARKIAGAVSVACMLVLTGCMAAAAKLSTSTTSAKTSVSTNASTAPTTTTATTVPTETNEDDGYSSVSTTSPAVAPAVPGIASSQPITLTNAS